MLDDMEIKFNQIRDVSEESIYTTRQFTIQVFRALLTTTNQDFWRYAKGKKYPFDEGQDVDIFDIILSVRAHYVNNKLEFDCMDPKDAAIIALTSKLNNIENKLKMTNGGNSNSQGNSNSGRKQGKGKENNLSKESSDKGKNKGLPEWRIKFKGITITHDGKEY
eukprot:540312-Ditylum_brightwellii.AAC.1